MAQALAHRDAQYAIRDYFEDPVRTAELAKVLPKHIRPDHFQRVVLTAVARDPDLAMADLRSLYMASLQCAHDGLVPDGREAVLVVYGDKVGYQRMTAGIRKLVQQSGEISRFEQTVVYSNDRFSIRYGDRPQIHHEPPLNFDDRGTQIAVYSVAQYKDGTLSRDFMSAKEVEKHRAVSRAPNGNAWRNWWDEMAKKTVAKRHAKILPMSSDAAAALDRDGDDDDPDSSPAEAKATLPPARRPRLAEQVDNLVSSEPSAEASEATQPKRGRGRPKKQPMPATGAATTDYDVNDAPTPDVEKDAPAPAPDDEFIDDEPPEPPPDPREEPSYDGPPDSPLLSDPDFERGWRDARSSTVKTCLNSAIKADPRRHARWQAGYNAWLDQRAQESA